MTRVFLILGAEDPTLTFWQQLVLKLFDWPIVLAVILVGMIVLFRRPLGELLMRGGVTLAWGDKSIAIAELPEKLNEDFAPITDDIQDLKERLLALEQQPSDAPPTTEPPTTPTAEDTAKTRMLALLASGEYRWRSIERLARAANISVNDATNLLEPLTNEVVFGHNQTTGRTLVRLKSR